MSLAAAAVSAISIVMTAAIAGRLAPRLRAAALLTWAMASTALVAASDEVSGKEIAVLLCGGCLPWCFHETRRFAKCALIPTVILGSVAAAWTGSWVAGATLLAAQWSCHAALMAARDSESALLASAAYLRHCGVPQDQALRVLRRLRGDRAAAALMTVALAVLVWCAATGWNSIGLTLCAAAVAALCWSIRPSRTSAAAAASGDATFRLTRPLPRTDQQLAFDERPPDGSEELFRP